MLLMTDGNANRCTYGICNTYTAGQEAISEAQRAYDDYGIRIYTVAFGDDADTALLEEIANVSGGKSYIADGTNISDVYQEIAVEITNVYPLNPWLDVGKDGDHEWFYAGYFDTTETAEFQAELDSLKDCICTGCTVDGTHCIIDMKTFSEGKGFISLSDILIEICVYTTDPTSYPGAPELCDGKDNDGDLDIDEDFANLGSSCTSGTGACQSSGIFVCSGDMLSTVCSAVPGSPSTETCDGIDNDCDGYVDEGVCITTTSGGSSGGGGGVSEYCGNLFCASTENCTTCPQDCGECPPQEEGEQCVPDWSCTAWSDCSPDGSQTRDCTDLNACEGAFSGPVTEQQCAYQQAGAGQTGSAGITGLLTLDPLMGLYWAAIIVMVLVAAGGIVLWKKK